MYRDYIACFPPLYAWVLLHIQNVQLFLLYFLYISKHGQLRTLGTTAAHPAKYMVLVLVKFKITSLIQFEEGENTERKTCTDVVFVSRLVYTTTSTATTLLQQGHRKDIISWNFITVLRITVIYTVRYFLRILNNYISCSLLWQNRYPWDPGRVL